MRAVWIGFIGINSVFPKGIKTDSKSYSSYFMEQVKKDYDIKESGIDKLDKICSSIFAINTLGIILTVTFVINIVVLYGIKLILDLFLPPTFQLGLAALLGIVFIGISIYINIINGKKYENNRRLQERGYKIYSSFNAIFLHVARKPYNYLANLIGSNIEKGRFMMWMIISIIPMMALSGYYLITSGTVKLADPENSLKAYQREDITQLEEYETNLDHYDQPILSALIESELISGKVMKLFVPIFGNENVVFEELCGIYQPDDKLDEDANRKKERFFNLDCYHKYHEVLVNEEKIDCQFIKHYHPHRNTFGVLTYLPTDKFIAGKNQ